MAGCVLALVLAAALVFISQTDTRLLLSLLGESSSAESLRIVAEDVAQGLRGQGEVLSPAALAGARAPRALPALVPVGVTHLRSPTASLTGLLSGALANRRGPPAGEDRRVAQAALVSVGPPPAGAATAGTAARWSPVVAEWLRGIGAAAQRRVLLSGEDAAAAHALPLAVTVLSIPHVAGCAAGAAGVKAAVAEAVAAARAAGQVPVLVVPMGQPSAAETGGAGDADPAGEGVPLPLRRASASAPRFCHYYPLHAWLDERDPQYPDALFVIVADAPAAGGAGALDKGALCDAANLWPRTLPDTFWEPFRSRICKAVFALVPPAS